MLSTKLYVHDVKHSKTPPLKTIYKFRADNARAKHWLTEESAKMGASALEQNRPTIGHYICGDFQIEKRSPGEFVIYCEVPNDYLAEFVPSAEPW